MWAIALLIPPGRLETQKADPYTEAKQAFAAREFRKAADLFARAAVEETSSPPQHPDTLLLEAKSLVNLNQAGELPAAEHALRSYLLAHSRSSEALYLLGYVLERENKPKDSLGVFTEAAAIAPPTPNDLKLVALDYVLLEDYADAVRWLDRSIAGDPRDAEAWYFLGRARMQGGNFAQAERNFRRVLTLKAGDPKALDNLGLSLEAQNRSDEAVTAYTEAIAAEAGAAHPSEQPLLNLGTLLNSKGRSVEALPPLQRAVALAPSCSRCREELARAYLACGKDALAIQEMEGAIATDPKNPRLHFQLGQMYRRAGLAGKAEAELKTSAELYGSHSTAPDK